MALALVTLCLSIACPQSIPPDDETAFRLLMERFFAAYAAEDLPALIALWSKKSPESQGWQKTTLRDFHDADFSFANLRLLRLQRQGDKATLCVSVDAIVKSFRLPMPMAQTLLRNFVLMREEGGWKIWRCVPTAEEFAQRLASVQSDAEWEALLNSERELLNGELVEALLKVAECHLDLGEPSQARRLAQLAQKIATYLDDPAGYALARFLEGYTFWLTGDLERAIAIQEETIAWAQQEMERRQKTEPPEKFARLLETAFRLLYWAGVFYADILGDGEKALQKYQAMAQSARQFNALYAEAVALNGLGGQLIGMGKAVQGIQTMERAIQLFERLRQAYPQSSKLARTSLTALNCLASAYNGIQMPDQSVLRYQKSLRLAQQFNDRVGEMGAVWGLGCAYRLKSDLAKAQAHFERSLKLAREERHFGWIYTNLGSLAELHLQQGNLDAALRHAEEALQVARQIQFHLWELGALENIARILVRKGDEQRAQAVLAEGLRKAERLNLSPAGLYTLVGNLHRRQGRWQQAILAYQKATEQWERSRAMMFEPTGRLLATKDEWVEPYRHLAACLARLGRKEEALQVSERMKARTLAEILQSVKLDITKAMTDEEKQKERQLRDQLNRLNAFLRTLQNRPDTDPHRLKEWQAKLNEARQSYESFRRQLYLRHPELAILRAELPPLTTEQLQQLLPDDRSAFLSYLLDDDLSFVFVLTHSANDDPSPHRSVRLYAYPLPINRSGLTQLVRSFRSRLEQRALKLPEATQLYRYLIAPLEGQLKGKKVIGIIPDGVLWELPFAALRDGNGKYLVERFALFYAPSLTTLYAMRHSPRQSPPTNEATLLALAFPSFGALRKVELPLRGTFEELPQTEREVKTIARLFGKGARVYLREQATESLLKREAPHSRIVHIATHGVFDPQAPLYSGVLLAQEREEDGILEAWEIADMDLNADLVVLSACETARGQVREGEGLIGLAWALFVAGCRSSLLTQWQVADESTAHLMLAFYRHWRPFTRSPLSKAEALQQAQLELLRSKDWAHPFFWAPFVLLGDGR
jgi:CHAT domain-containing protein